MNEIDKRRIKKSLLTLSIAGIMVSSMGCKKEAYIGGEIPPLVSIDRKYNNFDKYCKVENGVKYYNTANVYLLFDKKTYEASEYIYAEDFMLTEVYELTTEQMVLYSSGLEKPQNADYYKYLLDNTYQVALSDIGSYLDGEATRDFYSLDEIKVLEPALSEVLKDNNQRLVKTKN